jgi:hypothetical protein
MGTSLCHSSDDTNSNSRTSPRTRTEIMSNQTTPVTVTMHSFCPCPQFFCLLKPTTHVCTLKMVWVLTLPLPTVCLEPCKKSPFSSFAMPLHLAFRGRWPDLAYGLSRVWALGPKLQFQWDSTCKDSQKCISHPYFEKHWLSLQNLS